MTSKDHTWKLGTVAIVFWVSLPLLLIDIALGSFVVPSLVPHWKAQGLTSAPFPWQLVVDVSDFSKLHWYVFPFLLIGALVATFLTLGRSLLQLLQSRRRNP
jgi:type II secretory pathway component PulF